MAETSGTLCSLIHSPSPSRPIRIAKMFNLVDFVGGIKTNFMKTMPIRFNIQCHVSKLQLKKFRMQSVPSIFFIISLPFILFCRFHSQIYCRFFLLDFSFILRVRKSSHLSFSCSSRNKKCCVFFASN